MYVITFWLAKESCWVLLGTIYVCLNAVSWCSQVNKGLAHMNGLTMFLHKCGLLSSWKLSQDIIKVSNSMFPISQSTSPEPMHTRTDDSIKVILHILSYRLYGSWMYTLRHTHTHTHFNRHSLTAVNQKIDSS